MNYLKGKKVILVGPAEYLEGQGRGNEIDEYDVIIRMNLGCPVPEELKGDLGSRTDVLYHVVMGQTHVKHRPDLFSLHTKKEVMSWKNDGVKWLVSKRSTKVKRVGHLKKIVGNLIPFIVVPSKIMDALTKALMSNPNMAPVVVAHVLEADIESLKIIGCDFFKTGYHVGYGGFSEEQAKKGANSSTCWGQVSQPGPLPRHRSRNSKTGRHDIYAQMKYLRNRARDDSRLDVSEVMERFYGGA